MGTNKKVKQTAKNLFLTIATGIMCLTINVNAQLTAPQQPEVTGFEPINTTDMVNLSTGDFTYSLPVIHVPGDGGGFSMPLSYHSGVQMDQEASWVGLGWSINPGAINRSVNEFADDFNGEERLEHFESTETIEGWGLNFLVATISNDSERGWGGSVSIAGILTVGFGTQMGWSALGFSANENGAKFSPIGFVLGVAQINALGAKIDAKKAEKAFNVKNSTENFAKSINADAALTKAKSVKSALGIATAPFSYGSLVGGLAASNGSKNINNLWTLDQRNYFFYYDYKYYLNTNVSFDMYGSLYLGNQPARAAYSNNHTLAPLVDNNGLSFANTYLNDASKSIASDMHMNLKDGEYEDLTAPASVAYDNYNVMGEGISGRIQPYRMETGSLARTSYQDWDYFKYQLTSFLPNKVPFRYAGELANYYQWHQSTTTDDFGFLHSVTPQYESDYLNWATYEILDERLKNLSDRIESETPDRGLYAENTGIPYINNYRMASGKFVNWFTNDEMESAAVNGYIMEYFPELVGDHPRNLRGPYPNDGIGGFAITRPDGTTYHYALPVYNLYEKNYSSRDDEFKTFTQIEADYATTWLLTAITGSDFVDRSSTGTPNGRVDEYDWGYWVKFEYGKFGDQHKWNSPLVGFHEAPDNPDHISFVEGIKEMYYLDEIKTRTHTTIFVKNTRLDNQLNPRSVEFVEHEIELPIIGIFKYYVLEVSGTTGEIFKSLYLSDTYLLDNKDYNYLVTNCGLSKANNGDITNHNYDNVWDVNDLTSCANDLYSRQLSRINFGYEYELCGYAPGAENCPGGSRLTLKNTGVYHTNNIKTIPDNIFKYASNPSYDKDSRDGWGMHRDYDAPWHLTNIISPLGGEIVIDYERDSYAEVAGSILDYNWDYTGFVSGSGEESFIPSKGYQLGDVVNVSGEYFYDDVHGTSATIYFSKICTITSINSNKIYLDQDIIPEEIKNTYTSVQFYEENENLDIVLESRLLESQGGDVRVASIKTKDENANEYETRYDYTIEGSKGPYTSGVCSSEPEQERHDMGIYNSITYGLFDYPSTPVMYKKVSVLDGVIGDNFTSKTEHNFVTPDRNMISFGDINVSTGDEVIMYKMHDPLDPWYSMVTNRNANYVIDINTAQIGQVKSTKQFNIKDELLGETSYEYISDGNELPYGKIGKFTEGSIISELYRGEDEIYYYRLIRTTKNFNPSIIKSVKTVANGQVSTIENTEYDILTGNVLETEYVTPMGDLYRTRSVPAYTIPEYSTMGFKAADLNNKNMISQEAENYLFLVEGGVEKVINANIQTWKDSWGYRDYSSGGYSDVTYPGEVNWKKHKGFAYKTSLLSDGSYIINTSNKFDYSATDEVNKDKGWQKGTEYTRFTHYSIPYEVKDINGKYAAHQIGLNGTLTMATAGNANYLSFAFTGFEEEVDRGGEKDWGGEIMGTGTRIKSEKNAHTGEYYLKLSSSGLNIDMTEMEKDRLYRASVWVRSNSSESIALSSTSSECGVGGDKTCRSIRKDDDQAIQMGDWYLLNITFKAIAGSSVTIDNDGGNGDIYIDDFRIHPVDAPLQSYAYEEKTGLMTAALNNENFATKFEYDEAGRLIATYKETPDGFKKISEHEYVYAGITNYECTSLNVNYIGSLSDNLVVTAQVKNNYSFTSTMDVVINIDHRNSIVIPDVSFGPGEVKMFTENIGTYVYCETKNGSIKINNYTIHSFEIPVCQCPSNIEVVETGHINYIEGDPGQINFEFDVRNIGCASGGGNLSVVLQEKNGSIFEETDRAYTLNYSNNPPTTLTVEPCTVYEISGYVGLPHVLPDGIYRLLYTCGSKQDISEEIEIVGGTIPDPPPPSSSLTGVKIRYNGQDAGANLDLEVSEGDLMQFVVSLEGGVTVSEVDIVWTIMPRSGEPSFTVEDTYWNNYASTDRRRFDILLTVTYGGTIRTDNCGVELRFTY